jgi:hypothetical protein
MKKKIQIHVTTGHLWRQEDYAAEAQERTEINNK